MQPFAVATLAPNWRSKFGRQGLAQQLKNHVGAVNSQLEKREYIDTLIVTNFEWNQDNGFLTSTMKIARRHIAKYFQTIKVSEELRVEWKKEISEELHVE